MNYKDVTIHSRVTGQPGPAKMLECDMCDGREFLVYIVLDHPHLQCLKCGTTHCQGEKCSGADELEMQEN